MSTSPIQPAGGKRPWLTLALLLLVFGGPLVAAWLAVQHDAFRPGGTSVKGHLVEPARPVDSLALRGLGGGDRVPGELRGRWLLLYIGDSVCDEICQRSLHNMRQTRLALGEDTHRTRRLLVVTDGALGQGLRDLLARWAGTTSHAAAGSNTVRLAGSPGATGRP